MDRERQKMIKAGSRVMAKALNEHEDEMHPRRPVEEIAADLDALVKKPRRKRSTA